MKLANKIVLSLAVYFLTAGFAFANEPGIDPPIPGDVAEIIQRIIGFLFGLALLISPIFIIWGGFEIATAAGAQQKITEGKRRITYALVGLVIMALANAFVAVIKDILGV